MRIELTHDEIVKILIEYIYGEIGESPYIIEHGSEIMQERKDNNTMEDIDDLEFSVEIIK